MLKDPNFDIIDLMDHNKYNGIFFSIIKYINPINGCFIPLTCGIMDTTSLVWSSRLSNSNISTMQPSTLMLLARHGKGIYLSCFLEESIDHYCSTELIESNASFDLKSGQYYDYNELTESYTRICGSEVSDKPLMSGKMPPIFSKIAQSYGIADNMTQIMKHYRNVFMRTDYDVCIQITHYDKNDMKGLRWHKQGAYLGTFKKKYEYMCSEDGFDSFIKYNILVIK